MASSRCLLGTSGSWAASGAVSSERGEGINCRVLCEVLSSNRVNDVDTVNVKELSICIFLHMASFQIFSDHMWIQRGFDDSCFFDFLLYFFF